MAAIGTLQAAPVPPAAVYRRAFGGSLVNTVSVARPPGEGGLDVAAAVRVPAA